VEDLEWRTLSGNINIDIADIVGAHQILGERNDELRRRTERPIEEDLIDADAEARMPQPHASHS
jgi:hypothetical protein